MGGKKKDAQRTKGNLKPASSAKAGELLEASGLASAGFIGFGAFTQAVNSQGGAASVPLPAECADGEIRMVMKRMTKRDSVTKLKALQSFIELCQQREADVLLEAMQYWPRLYNKVSMDNDRRVRELSHLAMCEISNKLKKSIAPHLKSLIGPWLMSFNDSHAPAASAARQAFTDIFPSAAKQADVILYCLSDLFKYLEELLFNSKPETLSDPKIFSVDEMNEKYLRVLSVCLSTIELTLTLLNPEKLSELTPKLESILSNSTFWKLAKHDNSQIRAAWFNLVSSICDQQSDLAVTYSSKITPTVFTQLAESDPVCCCAVWKCAISVVKIIPDFYEHVNMQKAVLPALWSALKNAFSGNSAGVSANLLPLLSQLPDSVTSPTSSSGAGFYNTFFSNLLTGLNLDRVQTSLSEMNSLVKCYIECLRYTINHCLTNSHWTLIEQLLNNQLLDVIKRSLLDKTCNLYKSCLYKQLLDFSISLSSRIDNEEQGSQDYSSIYTMLWDVIRTAINDTENSEHFALPEYTNRVCRLVIDLTLNKPDVESKPTKFIRFTDESNNSELSSIVAVNEEQLELAVLICSYCHRPIRNGVINRSLLKCLRELYTLYNTTALFDNLQTSLTSEDNSKLLSAHINMVKLCSSSEMISDSIALLVLIMSRTGDLKNGSENESWMDRLNYVMESLPDHTVELLGELTKSNPEQLTVWMKSDLSNSYMNRVFNKFITEDTALNERLHSVISIIELCQDCIRNHSDEIESLLQESVNSLPYSVTPQIAQQYINMITKLDIIKPDIYVDISQKLIQPLVEDKESIHPIIVTVLSQLTENDIVNFITQFAMNTACNLKTIPMIVDVIEQLNSQAILEKLVDTIVVSDELIEQMDWCVMTDNLLMKEYPTTNKNNASTAMLPSQLNIILLSAALYKTLQLEVDDLNSNQMKTLFTGVGVCQSWIKLHQKSAGDDSDKIAVEFYEGLTEGLLVELVRYYFENSGTVIESLAVLNLCSRSGEYIIPVNAWSEQILPVIEDLLSKFTSLTESQINKILLLPKILDQSLTERFVTDYCMKLLEEDNSVSAYHRSAAVILISRFNKTFDQTNRHKMNSSTYILSALIKLRSSPRSLFTNIQFSCAVMKLFTVIIDHIIESNEEIMKTLQPEDSQWDFILCTLDGWVGEQKSALPKSLEDNNSLLYMTHLLKLLISVTTMMSKTVVNNSKCFPHEFLSEWVELHCLTIYNHLLPYFIKSAGVTPKIPLHKQILDDLSVVVSHTPTICLDKHSLPLKLIPDTCTNMPRPVESLLNHLLPHLMSPIASVQQTSFVLLRRMMPSLPKYEQATEDNMIKEEEAQPLGILLSIIELSHERLLTLGFGQSIANRNQSIVLEDNSHEILCLRAYLLSWHLLIKYLQYSTAQQIATYSSYLKTHNLSSDVLTTIFNVLLDLLRTEFNDNRFDITHPDTYINSTDVSYSDMRGLSYSLYYLMMKILPVVTRSWCRYLEQNSIAIVERLTSKEVSTQLLQNEMLQLRENPDLMRSDNLNVKTRIATDEIIATYTFEEFSIELLIKLPSNYPIGLTTVECSKRLGVAANEWRKWMLQLTTFLTYQNGSVANAILLWKSNLDKKFSGVEECYICFSVLHGTNLQLPKQQCRTCRKKFHSACLYKWFTSSQKSTCPLCRNLF